MYFLPDKSSISKDYTGGKVELKPFIYAKLQMNNYYGEIIAEYLTNYMCFIVLSVEIFSILCTFGVVKSIVVLLFVNTAVFIGLLVVGLVKMDLRGKEVL